MDRAEREIESVLKQNQNKNNNKKIKITIAETITKPCHVT
jgi:hypothetical protein